ncbi:MAG: patatin-like protein [Pseudomonadota bacterium]
MIKRELRLAVVIYGGASLAVYMHGVTKELLKLVRASKVLHEIGPEAAASMRYGDGPDARAHDTEAVYFELLQQLNTQQRTRIIIDVIAGASAGAINGIMLAKALVDDASLDAHTDLWLSSADADELRRESVSRWRKWYLYPLFRALAFWLPDSITEDEEVRGKMARLARSSWFTPPFSGRALCHRFLEAFDTMRRSRREGSALLPPSQRLDVYASITDLLGYPRLIRLHDRLVAREREHGAYCRFSHRQWEPSADSDFADANTPALAWAARASSSFTGAFPPFRHRELMAVLEERSQSWPGENRFLQDKLFDRGGNPASAHFDPRSRAWVDGGIVNNKPFAAVLEALAHRPADRLVDRVVLYVEPDPSVEDAAADDQTLGYLGTIRAAASSIPRNQPILDDLQLLMRQDERARNNRRVLDSNRAQIAALVDRQLEKAGEPTDARALGAARQAMASVAAIELGLGYRAYAERRLWRLAEALAEEWAVLAGPMPEPAPQLFDARARDPESERRLQMLAAIRSWWLREEPADATSPPDHQRQDAFLAGFDVSYRIRWVQHLIRQLNQHDLRQPVAAAAQDALQTLKGDCYLILEQLQHQRRARGVQPRLAELLIEAAAQLPLATDEAAVLLRKLSATMSLTALDRQLDAIMARFAADAGEGALRHRLLMEYLAFPLQDAILMTPGAEDGGPDPLTELRVERISPADRSVLADAFEGLKCRQFMGFLGFFSRGHREHDYLWGRLHGAERIVHLLTSLQDPDGSVPTALAPRRATIALAQRILQRERRRLHQCVPTITQVEDVLRAARGDPEA